MSRGLTEVEARGLGSNDVVLIEQIFQRVMSQGPVLARTPAGGRLRSSKSSSSSNKNYNKTNSKNCRNSNSNNHTYSAVTGSNSGSTGTHAPSRSASYTRSRTKSPPLGGPVGLYVAPGLLDGGGGAASGGGHGNAENMAPFRYHRSAGPGARRQMAIECGLKSLPVTTKWTPTGRSNLMLDNADQVHVTHNQVYLQAPEGNVSARRGLSGSKVRQSVATPRPGSHTPRSASLPGSDHQDQSLQQQQLQQPQQQLLYPLHHHSHHHQHHQTETVGYPISPSPRPQSKRLNSRLSSAPVEGDGENGLVRHYKWNSSEQGIRLQRQLSSLSSCRSIKRASEMVSHRLDPMYLMSGSKVSLQNRYGIDEQEMQRLHEMTQIREGLLSDLKKMKFPYGARASKHVVQRTHKLRTAIDDTPRMDDDSNQSKAILDPAKTTTAHPSTPASDPAEGTGTVNREEQEERPASEHTDDEESVHAATE